MGLEIEEKWIPEKSLAERIMALSDPVRIEQGYLCTEPVIRVRREGNGYCMTYKGKGNLKREEYNLPLNETAFEELLPKCSGKIIVKDRYTVPFKKLFPAGNEAVKGARGEMLMELDIFHGDLEGLRYLEIEFAGVEDAEAFKAPLEFGENVTNRPECSNAALSRR